MQDKIKFFALGGLDENGKNMFVFEINENIFVIEAGMKYPDKHTPGVDVIIPDFSYLIENKDRVKAYIISHGHDDQMGTPLNSLPEPIGQFTGQVSMPNSVSISSNNSKVSLASRSILLINVKIGI